jgi:hypothetical protein
VTTSIFNPSESPTSMSARLGSAPGAVPGTSTQVAPPSLSK